MIKRQDVLLTKLLMKDKISMKDLSEEFQVSERTLRNDIQRLQELTDGEELIVISKGFIHIRDSEKFQKEVQKAAKDSDFYQYRLSAEERRMAAIIMIICEEEYTTADYLAGRLFVSRSTMTKEIIEIKNRLAEEGIILEARTKKGYRICGDELQIRRLAYKLFKGLKHEEGIYSWLIEKVLQEKIEGAYIRQALLQYEADYKLDLLDTSFKAIETYLLITVIRILQGNIAGSSPVTSENQFSQAALELLQKVLKEFGYDGEVTEEEVQGFNEIFMDNFKISSQDSTTDIEMVTTQMIIASFVWTVCMSLDIKDRIGYQNYESLMEHIKSTIYHLRNNDYKTQNPLCEELEQMYPEIFEHVAENIKDIERMIGKKMEKDEISYIVMHIASALELLKAEKQEVSALIICPAGLCTAMLLKVKLKQNFNIYVEDIIPAHKLEKYDRSNIDMVIATVPLKDELDIAVQINPLLYENDIIKIQNYIKDKHIREKKKNRQHKKEISRILSYVEEYNKIISENDTVALFSSEEKLDRLNQKYKLMPEKIQGNQWFYRELCEEMMTLDLIVNDWKEAIYAAGRMLEKVGHCSNKYTERMVELVRKNGPYIVFAPGVAIAHASPRDGAVSLGISFIRLKNPVNFGHDINDPVKFVLAVSIPDENSYLSVFFHMVRCMANREIQTLLFAAENKTDIINMIKFYEIRQFNNEQ